MNVDSLATLIGTFSSIKITDVIDIVVVSIIIYRILIMIQGTRALQILYGMGFLLIAYVISELVGFYTLHWILSAFLGSVILVVVVLFQPEFRRALARFASNPFSVTQTIAIDYADELVRSTTALVNRRIGALIVLEKTTGLNEYIDEGIQLDAAISRELLVSIFLPSSPIHDGAVIIRNGRIVAAGCFFPLATEVELDKDLGTRHRAAIGVSQETDSLVIVVSEERAQVSIVHYGRITSNVSNDVLLDVIHKNFG